MKLMKILSMASAFILLIGIASATTVIPMTVDELNTASTQVFLGRAGESWSAWDAGHHSIYTYTKFTVSETLKGQAAQTVVLKQMGGQVGDIQQTVHGIRYFAPGEQAVVFVHPSIANDNTMVITGLMQGNFHLSNVNGVTIASNGVTGVERLDEQSHTISRYVGTRLPLVELERRVRGAQRSE